MWPLLLLLTTCAALPSTNAWLTFPFTSSWYTSVRPSFGIPSWYERPWSPRIPTFNFPTFDWVFDFPEIPTIKIPKIEFPPIPSPTAGSVCREVPDVPDLAFPPHAEIPADKFDPESIVKNDVKHTTYQCRDSKNNYFYKLVTTAIFATPIVKNEQTTIKYYTPDKKEIHPGDMNVDKNSLWEKNDFTSDANSVFKPSYSNWWPASPKVEETIRCQKESNKNDLPYPDVDDPTISELAGDTIVARDITHETMLCTNSQTKDQYYLLKSKLTVKTEGGNTLNRFKTISHPIDGNAPHIVSSSISTSSSFSTGNK